MNKASYRKGYLTAEFLSEDYRLSGEVSLRQGALLDMLNDAMTSFIRLENVYASPIVDPATIKGHYPIGQVRKDNLTMVVVASQEDAQTRRPLNWAQGTHVVFSVFITVPGFEIQGGLKIESAVDIERMFIYGSERFIVVYNATATVTTNPLIQFTGGAILLNRDQLGIFCIERSAS
jgi:hypothetical protein